MGLGSANKATAVLNAAVGDKQRTHRMLSADDCDKSALKLTFQANGQHENE